VFDERNASSEAAATAVAAATPWKIRTGRRTANARHAGDFVVDAVKAFAAFSGTALSLGDDSYGRTLQVGIAHPLAARGNAPSRIRVVRWARQERSSVHARGCRRCGATSNVEESKCYDIDESLHEKQKRYVGT
jgi:hypothetical protein